MTNPIKIDNIPNYLSLLFLDGPGICDGSQAILGIIHFISSMVAGFDNLGGYHIRDAILCPIYFLGTIGLHLDGLGR